MNTWKLKVGCWKEYETCIGVHAVNEASIIAHNDRRFEYRKELEWFEEKTFKSREDLERWKQNMYGDNSEFAFSIQRLNMLGDWCSEHWFSS